MRSSTRQDWLAAAALLAGLFAALLLYAALTMLRSPTGSVDAGDDATAGSPRERSLSGPGYRVGGLGRGAAGGVVGGAVSALLGIGGGPVMVPVMHLLMGVPLRVAAATSNLMIGVTASASAVIYLLRGEIDPYVAGPTAIGVFLGATAGSRVAHRINIRILRVLFVAVLLYTAFQMSRRALGLAG